MKHLSTLRLHQLRYGELDAAEEAEVRAHVADCERCRARLQAQQNQRAAFELEPVPEVLRTPPRRQWGFLPWLVGPLVALAAVLLVVRGVMPDTEEGIRTKGGEGIEVWVEAEDGPRPLGQGEALDAGERIQLRYRATGASVVTFAGRDAAGIEVYGTYEVPSAEGWQVAPFALTLDDAPGRQRFYAVFSERRPEDDEVRAAIEGRKGDLEVREVLVEKAP